MKNITFNCGACGGIHTVETFLSPNGSYSATCGNDKCCASITGASDPKDAQLLFEQEFGGGINPDTEPDESMDGDHESALASAGFGVDEDYGGGCEHL